VETSGHWVRTSGYGGELRYAPSQGCLRMPRPLERGLVGQLPRSAATTWESLHPLSVLSRCALPGQGWQKGGTDRLPAFVAASEGG
jgi:hypothetical protein